MMVFGNASYSPFKVQQYTDLASHYRVLNGKLLAYVCGLLEAPLGNPPSNKHSNGCG